MKIVYQAKLELPPGAVAPDAFEGNNGAIPSDTFIVSRDRAGHPRSLFGDLIWDFSAYSPEGRKNRLHFNFWGADVGSIAQLKISLEIRRIIFFLIWIRPGVPLSTGTLRNYLSALTLMGDYADNLHKPLGSILEDETLFSDFIYTRCTQWMAETLTSLLPQLANAGPGLLGHDVVSDQCIQNIRKQNKIYRASLKQHPPMPTRIYALLISGLLQELMEWKTVAKALLNAALYCTQDPRAGRSAVVRSRISRELELPPKDFLSLEEILDDRSTEYFRSRERPINTKSLSALIGEAQYISKLVIQIYSGMRDDEANSLPYSCSTTTASQGITHHIILGRTTKYTHGLAKRTQWVTSSEGHDAISIAQQIADTIYKAYEVTPEATSERINMHPLFVSVSYLKITSQHPDPENGHFAPGTMDHRELPKSCAAIIEENDLRELEHIDPHRAWRSEERFQIGSLWKFTSHQTRRSLALYAQRSGLVSLPSLRRQLKHITEQMSRYYAKGSSAAKNFIGDDKDHFGLEWQSTQTESAALGYILNVLISDEVLFGGHANWVQQRLRKPDGVILMDRSLTLRRFKSGELAYRETILGGCTNVGTCDKVAVRWLHTACVADNCKNLVGNMGKLELVIAAQQKLIDRLESSSVEYRTENQDLQTLLDARDRVISFRGRD